MIRSSAFDQTNACLCTLTSHAYFFGVTKHYVSVKFHCHKFHSNNLSKGPPKYIKLATEMLLKMTKFLHGKYR